MLLELVRERFLSLLPSPCRLQRPSFFLCTENMGVRSNIIFFAAALGLPREFHPEELHAICGQWQLRRDLFLFLFLRGGIRQGNCGMMSSTSSSFLFPSFHHVGSSLLRAHREEDFFSKKAGSCGLHVIAQGARCVVDF